jgi:hypothetical protein
MLSDAHDRVLSLAKMGLMTAGFSGEVSLCVSADLVAAAVITPTGDMVTQGFCGRWWASTSQHGIACVRKGIAG